MVISFEVPKSVEQTLREGCDNPSIAAKVAFLVELYRQGKLTHHELGGALDLTRYETDSLLKRHNVTEDLITLEELDEQLRTAQTIIDRRS